MDAAPRPLPGEHPADYIERVITYLSQPRQRRLGVRAAADMRAAVGWLRRAKK